MENAGRQNHSVKVIPNNCLPEIRKRSGSAACLIPAAWPGMGSSRGPAAPGMPGRPPGPCPARAPRSRVLPPPSAPSVPGRTVAEVRAGEAEAAGLLQERSRQALNFLGSACSEGFLPVPLPFTASPSPAHLLEHSHPPFSSLTYFSLSGLSSEVTSSQKPSLTLQSRWPYFLPR